MNISELQAQTGITTWFERDRAYVGLHWLDENDGQPDPNSTILEFWDEAVQEEIEAGFLDPRWYHRDLCRLAIDRGMIEQHQKIVELSPLGGSFVI